MALGFGLQPMDIDKLLGNQLKRFRPFQPIPPTGTTGGPIGGPVGGGGTGPIVDPRLRTLGGGGFTPPFVKKKMDEQLDTAISKSRTTPAPSVPVPSIRPPTNRVQTIAQEVPSIAPPKKVVSTIAQEVPSIAPPKPVVSTFAQEVIPPKPIPVVAPPKPVVATSAREATPKPVPTVTPPKTKVDTTTEEVATDLQTRLTDFSTKLLDTTEDPIGKALAANAAVEMGLFNQAMRTSIGQQIASDPNLSRQGGGNALLFSMANQMGVQAGDLKATLAIDSANRVMNMNRYGFEAGIKMLDIERADKAIARRELLDEIDQKRSVRGELLNAGDYEAYAEAFEKDLGIEVDISTLQQLSPATARILDVQSALLDEAIISGDQVRAQEILDGLKTLVPELYGEVELSDLANRAFTTRNDRNESIEHAVRINIQQGDFDTALEGLKVRYPDSEKNELSGRAKIDSLSLEEINQILADSEKTPITDKSELIGREEELFFDSKISQIKNKSAASVIGESTNTLMKELQALGFDPTDPDLERAVRMHILNLETGGYLGEDGEIDPNALVQPWNPDHPMSFQFTDWLVLDDAGNVLDKGGDPYGEDNRRDPSQPLGQYYEKIDNLWQQYLVKTPKEERVSRDAFVYGTKGGTIPFSVDNVPEGIDISTEEKDPLLDGITVRDGKINGKDLTEITGPEWKQIVQNPENIKDLIEAGIVQEFSTPIPGMLRAGDFNKFVKDQGWDLTKDKYIHQNGKTYKLTRFVTDVFGFDEHRRGRVYAVNLETGVEEVISEDTEDI